MKKIEKKLRKLAMKYAEYFNGGTVEITLTSYGKEGANLEVKEFKGFKD
jgi:hypothetical protein